MTIGTACLVFSVFCLIVNMVLSVLTVLENRKTEATIDRANHLSAQAMARAKLAMELSEKIRKSSPSAS